MALPQDLPSDAPRSSGSTVPATRSGGPPPGAGSAEEAGTTRTDDFDEGRPPGPTPACDFWDALYQRRSIRRFEARAVPRELVQQVLHAGIWAPSSCNYQMWDLVAVDDPQVNARLAALSPQMGNAPVNVVVSYGRDFSEEGWANIQSASALIQNMSLAAQVLGLGTFWITQLGDREQVRELVGLPHDRLVIAVLAIGWPKNAPKKGPKRRPLSQVAHWNHYTGRPIPSSTDPADWDATSLAIYQRARVLNGLRHNKPRAWELEALDRALERFFPAGPAALASGEPPGGRWLDVLPCTGLLTEHLSRRRRGYAFDVVERTPEVAGFCAQRTIPRGRAFAWPLAEPDAGFEEPEEGMHDVVSCLFRLEDLAPADRPRLMRDLARWTKPGGRVLLAFVSSRSFHDWTESLRRRRGGPGGVEYVLAPDPNIGPFQALDPGEVEDLARGAGLVVEDRLGTQAVPHWAEIDFRARNFSPRARRAVAGLGKLLALLERMPGLEQRRGRFQYRLCRRPPGARP
jgi:nitroreductase/SAM-dependent methyltransferase